MAEHLSDKIREILKTAEGRDVDLDSLRRELLIDPTDKLANSNLRTLLSVNFVKEKLVRPSGKRDGVYRVIRQVQPIRVFTPDRQRRPIFNLKFPRDSMNGEQILAEHIILREGDLITLGGVKSMGKTTLCLLFTAENIALRPVLMGNEYTIFTDNHFEPAPRFLSKLDRMAAWVTWTDTEGDRFKLLPVYGDYAEYTERDKLNIYDWVNLDANELYNVGEVLKGIKASLGRGIGIAALQKGEGATNPRGGQFARDFSDLELLLDGYGESSDEILMTVKGVKEPKGKSRIVGKTFAYQIVEGGTQIYNFREVKRCPACHGTGYKGGGTCGVCKGKKFEEQVEF